MKENNEISFSEDYSIKNMNITNNEILQLRNILLDQNKIISINLKHKKSYINIKSYSFSKINQLMASYPEENVAFLMDKKILFTPRNSLGLSKSSIHSFNDNQENNSFSSSSFKFHTKKKIQEEIINTDKKPNIDEIININNENNDNNDEIENTEFIKNLKNMQKLQSISKNNNIKNNNNNRKLVIFKWIFHFYLISGIILCLHYLSFIFSKYNNYFYKWIGILLILSLIYVGYIGIKYGHTNIKYFILNGDNLFWTNFSLLILTILSLIAICLIGVDFEFINNQGFIGYLIVIIYIIIIFVESIYILYFDRIIEQISWDNVKKDDINAANKSDNLQIQLIDIK